MVSPPAVAGTGHGLCSRVACIIWSFEYIRTYYYSTRSTTGGGGICTPYGGGRTKICATSAGAGMTFVSGGKVSGPHIISRHRQVTTKPNTPRGLSTYVILFVFVVPVVATSVAASLTFSGMSIVPAMASFAVDFMMFLLWATLRSLPRLLLACEYHFTLYASGI